MSVRLPFASWRAVVLAVHGAALCVSRKAPSTQFSVRTIGPVGSARQSDAPSLEDAETVCPFYARGSGSPGWVRAWIGEQVGSRRRPQRDRRAAEDLRLWSYGDRPAAALA